MEQIHDRTDGTSKEPRTTWLQITLEAAVFAGIGALLCLAGSRIRSGDGDAVLVLASGLALHAGGVLRFVLRVGEFVELECPTCNESFHGLPERMPMPFRRRCAHCGSRLP